MRNRVLSMYRTIAHIVLLVEMRAATVEPLARSSTLCKNRVLSMYRTTVHIVLREGDACRLVSMICVRTWFYQILLLVYSLVYERAMPVGSLR